MVGYAEAAWYAPPDPLAFTAAECDEILDAAGPWIAGRDRDAGGSTFTLPRSDVAVLADDAVRQRVCDQLAARAAAAVAERDWPGITLGELAIELLRYRDGAGLGWHRDWLPGHPIFGRCTMAIGVQLSDPDAYAGGALEIETADGAISPPDARGTCSLYTIDCRHQAAVVAAGERLVLIAFVCNA